MSTKQMASRQIPHPFAAAALVDLSDDEVLDRLTVKHLSRAAYWRLWAGAITDNAAVRRGLRHPDPDVRAACCQILDHFLDDAALIDVAGCLDDSDPRVRGWALHTLGCDRCKEGACRPGEDVFIPAAMRMLSVDPSAHVRAVAAETLGRSSAARRHDVAAAFGRGAGRGSRQARPQEGWAVRAGAVTGSSPDPPHHLKKVATRLSRGEVATPRLLAAARRPRQSGAARGCRCWGLNQWQGAHRRRPARSGRLSEDVDARGTGHATSRAPVAWVLRRMAATVVKDLQLSHPNPEGAQLAHDGASRRPTVRYRTKFSSACWECRLLRQLQERVRRRRGRHRRGRRARRDPARCPGPAGQELAWDDADWNAHGARRVRATALTRLRVGGLMGRPGSTDTAVRLGGLAAAVGKGLAAGLAGTAAMTVSSTLEAKLRSRQPSTTPARAASRVLGVAPVDERGERRFNNLVHWGYGTGWGGVRGVLGAVGLGGVPATLAHLAAVWGGEQVVLPATGAGSPATQWEPREVAIDLWHHIVYATAVGMAYAWLDRR